MTMMVASVFLIIAVMILLFGRRVQSLFGQRRRDNKLVAKATVGCLRLGSLGCTLWATLSGVTIVITGNFLATGEPAGLREIFIGASGFILVVFLMLAVAWFISANFTRLNPEERSRAYEAYREAIQPCLAKMAEPYVRTYVQEETMEVLTKLDSSLKGTLLTFLGESGFLAGDKRILLSGADFSYADLSAVNLPRADLRAINLEHSILRNAMLFKANLRRARLRKADLSGANLQEADLGEADFAGATLDGTNLTDADLTGAKLSAEQLHRVSVRKTI